PSDAFCVITTPYTAISTLSLHDALPIWIRGPTARSNTPANALATNVCCRVSPIGNRRTEWRICLRTTAGASLARAFLILFRRPRSEEHTSELQSRFDLVCRLLLEKKNLI